MPACHPGPPQALDCSRLQGAAKKQQPIPEQSGRSATPHQFHMTASAAPVPDHVHARRHAAAGRPGCAWLAHWTRLRPSRVPSRRLVCCLFLLLVRRDEPRSRRAQAQPSQPPCACAAVPRHRPRRRPGPPPQEERKRRGIPNLFTNTTAAAHTNTHTHTRARGRAGAPHTHARRTFRLHFATRIHESRADGVTTFPGHAVLRSVLLRFVSARRETDEHEHGAACAVRCALRGHGGHGGHGEEGPAQHLFGAQVAARGGRPVAAEGPAKD